MGLRAPQGSLSMFINAKYVYIFRTFGYVLINTSLQQACFNQSRQSDNSIKSFRTIAILNDNPI